MVTFVDLSHPITHGLVTYPGLPAPVIGEHLGRVASRERYAPGYEFHIGRIEMIANTGTYLDAPFHTRADGVDVAQVPLERLVDVPGAVVDAPATGPIEPSVFDGVELSGRAVLVRTGWSRHFGTERYGDPSHPGLTTAAVDALVAAAPVLVGIDAVNVDRTVTGERPAHRGLLAAGILIVEHLTNLDRLRGPFRFTAVPAPVRGLGSFPVRAFATLDH